MRNIAECAVLCSSLARAPHVDKPWAHCRVRWIGAMGWQSQYGFSWWCTSVNPADAHLERLVWNSRMLPPDATPPRCSIAWGAGANQKRRRAHAGCCCGCCAAAAGASLPHSSACALVPCSVLGYDSLRLFPAMHCCTDSTHSSSLQHVLAHLCDLMSNFRAPSHRVQKLQPVSLFHSS